MSSISPSNRKALQKAREWTSMRRAASGKSLGDPKKWTAKDVPRVLLWAARMGMPMKKLLGYAMRYHLDEPNLRTLIKGLARQLNRKKNISSENIDAAICFFWNLPHISLIPANGATNDAAMIELPGLNRWSQSAASGLISFYLRRRGVPYSVSPGAYRKRLERMRQLGTPFEIKRPLLVTRAELTLQGELTVRIKKDKT